MSLIIALVLTFGITAMSVLGWLALNGTDAAMHEQQISLLQWRRRRNLIAVLLLGGIGVILLLAALVGDML